MLLRIAKYLVGSILSIACFALLGTFYRANDNVILLNLIVWAIVFVLTYIITYLIFFLIHVIFKKPKPLIIDGFLLFFEIISVIVFILAIIKDPNDSLFLNVVFIIVGGLAALSQLFFELINKQNKKSTDS